LVHAIRINAKQNTGKKNSEVELTEWKFIVISASYETLSCTHVRHRYDSLDRVKSNRIRKGHGRIEFTKRIKASPIVSAFTGCADAEIYENNPKHPGSPFSHSSRKTSIFRCGVNSCSVEEELSKSLGESDYRSEIYFEEQHASLSHRTPETRELFEGPLEMLYKARNYEPFTDPYHLFTIEFGSNIFKSCVEKEHICEFTESRLNASFQKDKSSLQDNTESSIRGEELIIASTLSKNNDNRNKLDQNNKFMINAHKYEKAWNKVVNAGLGGEKSSKACLNSSPVPSNKRLGKTTFNGSSIVAETKNMKTVTIKEGDKIIRKTLRMVDGRMIVKTETTITDPRSGVKVTNVEVKREDNSNYAIEDMPNDLLDTNDHDRILSNARLGSKPSNGFLSFCKSPSKEKDTTRLDNTDQDSKESFFQFKTRRKSMFARFDSAFDTSPTDNSKERKKSVDLRRIFCGLGS